MRFYYMAASHHDEVREARWAYLLRRKAPSSFPATGWCLFYLRLSVLCAVQYGIDSAEWSRYHGRLCNPALQELLNKKRDYEENFSTQQPEA